MSKYGWDLPPGCTYADIERAAGVDERAELISEALYTVFVGVKAQMESNPLYENERPDDEDLFGELADALVSEFGERQSWEFVENLETWAREYLARTRLVRTFVLDKTKG